MFERKLNESHKKDGDDSTLSNLDILSWKIEEKEWENLV